jgi:hypothetical protein
MKKLKFLVISSCLLLIPALVIGAVKVNQEKIYEAGVKAYESMQYEESIRFLESALEKGLSQNLRKSAYYHLYWSTLMKDDFERMSYWQAESEKYDPRSKIVFQYRLQWTAMFGQDDQVEKLLHLGDDINGKTPEGFTALMGATYRCREENVKLLLDNGADLNKEDIEGRTALIYAKQPSSTGVLKRLLREGEYLRRRTPLYLDSIYSRCNNDGVLLWLRKSGAKEVEGDYNTLAERGLRSVITAQEAYYIDHKRYASSIDMLVGKVYGLQLSEGVKVIVEHGDKKGYYNEGFS